MTLWIRSQCKATLVQPKKLSLGRYCGNYGVWCEGDSLGYYETEERCIEIIDEIQDLLVKSNPANAFMVLKNVTENSYEDLCEKISLSRENNFIAFSSCGNADIQVLPQSCIVYEMPQE